MSDRPDIAALEGVAREVAAEWGVELGEPFALARYSFVAPAGDDAVLKVTPPEDDESDEEAEALELWGGDGAVRLLRRDRQRRALLIERARPGDDIAALPEEEATQIAVATGLRLWRPAGEPFRWIGDHVPRWLDNAEGHELVPLARELYASLEVGRDDARARRLPPPQHPPAPRAVRSRSTRSRCSASRSTTCRRSSGTRFRTGCASTSPSGGSPPSPRPGSTRSGCGLWTVIRGAYLGADDDEVEVLRALV